MNAAFQDLRFALRQLRRAPGFTLIAVLTLALGIGANTAIFSLLDQALLRPLPVVDPQQLVILEGTGKAWQGHTSGHGGSPTLLFSYPMYRDLRDKATSLSGVLATSTSRVGILRHGEASVEEAELVTGNYFQLLGVQPALGRLFTASDDSVTATTPAAVLSYEYWRDHLGADRGVLGETLGVSGHSFNVIGVAAPRFRSAVWGQTPALFVPISTVSEIDPHQTADNALINHQDRWLNLIARLRNGTSTTQAQAQVLPLWHALRAEELKALGHRSPSFTDDFLTNSRLRLLPGARGLSNSRDRLETPLYVVMGMAFLVLLIASTNVASLLLVRSAGRVREFSLRYALGATARRVVAQLLLEGILIGLMGAIAGAALATPAIRLLSRQLTDAGDPALFLLGLNTRLLLFSFVLSLVVSVLFSLTPALHLLRPDLVASLKQQTGTAGAKHLTFRGAIVCLQVGLSILLLVGSGLLVRTLQNLRHVDVGFNTTHLLTFSVDPGLAGIPKDRVLPLDRQILDALTALPGVQSVAGTDSPELANSDSGTNVSVEGYTAPPDEDLDIGRIAVTANYFNTLQEPIVAGRSFTDTDDPNHPLVAIVNQSFARHYFGSDTAAIDRHVARGAGNKIAWMQIVGVSRDARHVSLRDEVKMTDFTPVLQTPKTNGLTFYLRTRNAPASLITDLRTAMRRLHPELPLQSLRTMDDQIDENLRNERIIGLLAMSFGLLATLLTGVGLYGVVAFTTAQRTREIGVRIALGSPRLAIARIVLADALRLVTLGIAVGLPVAFSLARLLRSQIFGVSPGDPLTLTVAVLTIALTAVAAALIPARRAATVSPTEALRTE